ncbi:MAG: hypothetical protein SD837_05205 [Candidatus Electrothrix scaldis]|nr:MAG: hypothetical protein SD837_05205 [Candidatus Electrothrix sp. GW3-3]
MTKTRSIIVLNVVVRWKYSLDFMIATLKKKTRIGGCKKNIFTRKHVSKRKE